MQHRNKSSGTRQFKVGELIKRSLIEIMGKGKFLHEALIDLPITISEVRVSPDLKTAIVYVLPLFGKQDRSNQENLVEILNSIMPQIRKMITNKIQLKYSPELIFKLDNSFDYASNISQLLDE